MFTGAAGAVSIAAVVGRAQAAGSVAGTGQSPWLLGSQTASTTAAVLNDFQSLVQVICSGYGTCCYYSDCNSAGSMKFNLILLASAILFSKVYF